MSDICQEETRSLSGLLLTCFKSLKDASHVTVFFDKPPSDLSAKQHLGWQGTWFSEQGRELYMTHNWGNSKRREKRNTVRSLALPPPFHPSLHVSPLTFVSSRPHLSLPVMCLCRWSFTWTVPARPLLPPALQHTCKSFWYSSKWYKDQVKTIHYSPVRRFTLSDIHGNHYYSEKPCLVVCFAYSLQLLVLPVQGQLWFCNSFTFCSPRLDTPSSLDSIFIH